MNNFKERIQNGDTVHGCWINLGSLVSAEIIGQAGFDWVLIDLEHGAGDEVTMYNQLQVLSGSGSTPIVRIDDTTRPKVQHILDAGATGIMFPQIQTPEQADLAARMMYYPPKGIRGMAKMVRATGFGGRTDTYINNLEKSIISVIQIETTSSIQHIDDIAAIDGVDVLFVGPSDLSLALGIFGQLHHPLYQQAIQEVARAAKNITRQREYCCSIAKNMRCIFSLGTDFWHVAQMVPLWQKVRVTW